MLVLSCSVIPGKYMCQIQTAVHGILGFVSKSLLCGGVLDVLDAQNGVLDVFLSAIKKEAE